MCDICLESSEIYSKCLTNCASQTCTDCLEEYLKHLFADSEAPICVNPNCSEIYPLETIPLRLMNLYREVCYRYLIRTKNPEIQQTLRTKQIIEKTRTDRLTFLQTEIPLAISTIAELVFKYRLQQVAPPKTKQFHRTCMTAYCPGQLNSELICDSCETQFCQICENVMSLGHVCRSEDLESIKLRNLLPKCPKCHQPVDKDDGCDHVRCGVCGIAFHYSTGEIGGGGGHTQIVKTKTEYKLSSIYSISADQLPILLRLEAIGEQLPRKNSDQIIRSLINQDQGLATKHFNQYHRVNYQRRAYFQMMSEIEDVLKNNPEALDLLQYE